MLSLHSIDYPLVQPLGIPTDQLREQLNHIMVLGGTIRVLLHLFTSLKQQLPLEFNNKGVPYGRELILVVSLGVLEVLDGVEIGEELFDLVAHDLLADGVEDFDHGGVFCC